MFELKILGGLRVTIEYKAFRNEVYAWRIAAVAGRPCVKRPNWLHNRIDEAEEERIVEACAADHMTNQLLCQE